MVQTKPGTPAKLKDIQKLRAVAICMVLFGHLPFAMPNALIHGYTGVSLFFVISGFVVTMTFLKRFPAPGEGESRRVFAHVRDFYVRRLFRIVPVAVIWVVIYFAAAQLMARAGLPYGTLPRWTREIGWFLSGFYNYFFAASRGPGLFGQYWSLAVEMQFYAVLPFLLILLRTQRQRVWLCVLSIVAVSTVLRMLTPSDMIGTLTHTQADTLFAGVLLYLVTARPSGLGDSKTEARIGRLSQLVKNLIFAALVVILLVLPSRMDGVVDPMLKYPVFTALATLIVFLAQRDTGWVFGGSAIADRFMEYVGDRSYSLYVCHVLLFSGVYPFVVAKYPALLPAWFSQTSVGVAVQVVMMFALALLVSDVSYRLIELPFIALGKRAIEVLKSGDERMLARRSAEVEVARAEAN